MDEQIKPMKAWQVMGENFELETKFKVVDYLGAGAYGMVCAVQNSEDGGVIAIKKCKKIFQSRTLAKRTLREMRLLRQFSHENIVKLRSILLPSDLRFYSDLYLVFEIMDTDLAQIIRSPQPLKEQHTQYFIYQLLRALEYLHSKNIVHRDIKPRNILVNADCTLKVADFGLARLYNPDGPAESVVAITDYVTTRWYRAPEVIVGWSRYGSAIDMWAVGCIVAELISRAPLFPGENTMKQLGLIIRIMGAPNENFIMRSQKSLFRQYMLTLMHKRAAEMSLLLPGASPDALDLIRRLLDYEPSRRPPASWCLSHRFIAGMSLSLSPPVCSPMHIAPEEFDFESRKPCIDDLRSEINYEIAYYNQDSVQVQALAPNISILVPKPCISSTGSGSGGSVGVGDGGSGDGVWGSVGGENGSSGIYDVHAEAATTSAALPATAALPVAAPYTTNSTNSTRPNTTTNNPTHYTNTTSTPAPTTYVVDRVEMDIPNSHVVSSGSDNSNGSNGGGCGGDNNSGGNSSSRGELVQVHVVDGQHSSGSGVEMEVCSGGVYDTEDTPYHDALLPQQQTQPSQHTMHTTYPTYTTTYPIHTTTNSTSGNAAHSTTVNPYTTATTSGVSEGLQRKYPASQVKRPPTPLVQRMDNKDTTNTSTNNTTHTKPRSTSYPTTAYTNHTNNNTSTNTNTTANNTTTNNTTYPITQRIRHTTTSTPHFSDSGSSNDHTNSTTNSNGTGNSELLSASVVQGMGMHLLSTHSDHTGDGSGNSNGDSIGGGSAGGDSSNNSETREQCRQARWPTVYYNDEVNSNTDVFGIHCSAPASAVAEAVASGRVSVDSTTNNNANNNTSSGSGVKGSVSSVKAGTTSNTNTYDTHDPVGIASTGGGTSVNSTSGGRGSSIVSGKFAHYKGIPRAYTNTSGSTTVPDSTTNTSNTSNNTTDASKSRTTHTAPTQHTNTAHTTPAHTTPTNTHTIHSTYSTQLQQRHAEEEAALLSSYFTCFCEHEQDKQEGGQGDDAYDPLESGTGSSTSGGVASTSRVGSRAGGARYRASSLQEESKQPLSEEEDQLTQQLSMEEGLSSHQQSRAAGFNASGGRSRSGSDGRRRTWDSCSIM